MPLAQITTDDVRQLLPQGRDFEEVGRGGQKLVFGCTIDCERYVVKLLLAASEPAHPDASHDEAGEIEARAKREVERMAACTAPTLVKLAGC